MENTSEFIATINDQPIEEITNNGTISINNLKVLMKINNIIDTTLFKDENGELHIPKRSIISIDYNEANKEVNFTYSYRRSMKNVYVRFDDKSQSAYDSFKKTLLELNKVKGVLYYPNSGNIRMEGEFTIDAVGSDSTTYQVTRLKNRTVQCEAGGTEFNAVYAIGHIPEARETGTNPATTLVVALPAQG